MSNEIMFPIKTTPSFEELLNIIADGFSNLSLSTTQLTVGLSVQKNINLSDKFIYIHDHRYGYFCWVSFDYLELAGREEKDIDLAVMVGISTRGINELKFSIIIGYILASYFNARIIYDDSHLLQNKDAYHIEELKTLVEQYIKDIYNQ